MTILMYLLFYMWKYEMHIPMKYINYTLLVLGI